MRERERGLCHDLEEGVSHMGNHLASWSRTILSVLSESVEYSCKQHMKQNAYEVEISMWTGKDPYEHRLHISRTK